MSEHPATSLPHPSPEDLVALAETRLDAADAEQLTAHLEACAFCRAMVDDLRAFGELEAPGDAWRVDDDELESTLAALKRRLPSPASPPEVTTVDNHSAGGGWRWLPWAAVVLLSVGLVIVAGSRQALKEELEAARKPRGYVVSAISADQMRDVQDCYQSDRPAYLRLVRRLRAGSYTATFRAREGQKLLTIEILAESEGDPELELPAGVIAPGDYDIVLHDVNREQDLETFSVRFCAPKGP